MSVHSRLASIVVAIALALAGFVSPAASATAVAECASIPGLTKAPRLGDERTPAGAVVEERTLPDGSSVPVIMIHGWTGRSEHTATRDGAFSSKIDLSASKDAAPSGDRSLVGQIQNVAGTSVYTFDYHDTSARWVTDPSIAPRLADAITCLAKAHGHRVIVVAHSMGGLATRAALAIIDADQQSAASSEYVSDVVTFGTPNTGSWIAAVAAGTMDLAAVLGTAPPSAIAAVRALLIACGSVTTTSLDDPGACGMLPDFLNSFDSEAGRALRMGSSEIRTLATWPDGVEVHALAGDIGLEVINVQWFGLSRQAGWIRTGDFIVTQDSAEAGAQAADSVSCEYTLSVADTAVDNILQAFNQRAVNDTKDNAYTNLTSGPCFHTNLMRGVELTNAALAVVAERVPWRSAICADPLLPNVLGMDDASAVRVGSAFTTLPNGARYSGPEVTCTITQVNEGSMLRSVHVIALIVGADASIFAALEESLAASGLERFEPYSADQYEVFSDGPMRSATKTVLIAQLPGFAHPVDLRALTNESVVLLESHCYGPSLSDCPEQ